MTIKALYPTTRPSLDLNFAATKRLDPRITFSRASTGTYVDADGLIKSAAVGQARFNHAPTTGESLGLLVEEAKTNLFTYSNDFTNAAWLQILGTAITRTPNNAVSPDGATNATEITASDFNFVRQSLGDTTAVRTLSIFAKAGTSSTINVRFFSGASPVSANAAFNLATGTATVDNASVMIASIVPFGNDWYRCVACRTDAVNKQPPDLSFGIGTTFIYGAQVELGAFPTSYIPTGASTITRSADVAEVTGSNFSNWYQQGEGSMLANSFYAAGPTRIQVAGAAGNFIAPVFNNNALRIQAGGADQYLVTVPVSPVNKNSLGYSANSIRGAALGTLLSEASPGFTIPTVDKLQFVGGSMTVSRCVYWPTRLSDGILQSITR
jgi:hypothetical protein